MTIAPLPAWEPAPTIADSESIVVSPDRAAAKAGLHLPNSLSLAPEDGDEDTTVASPSRRRVHVLSSAPEDEDTVIVLPARRRANANRVSSKRTLQQTPVRRPAPRRQAPAVTPTRTRRSSSSSPAARQPPIRTACPVKPCRAQTAVSQTTRRESPSDSDCWSYPSLPSLPPSSATRHATLSPLPPPLPSHPPRCPKPTCRCLHSRHFVHCRQPPAKYPAAMRGKRIEEQSAIIPLNRKRLARIASSAQCTNKDVEGDQADRVVAAGTLGDKEESVDEDTRPALSRFARVSD